MKKLLFLFAMIPLIGFGQVQNSKLAQNLLLSVQSGANAIPGAALTSGTVTSGVTYTIGNYTSNDDFTNIGAPSNASGVTFKATGTTPTHWAHSTILRPIHSTALTLPDVNYSLTNTGAIPTFGHKGNSSYLALNGTSHYIDLGTPASLDPGIGNISVQVRIRTTASSEMGIYSNYNSGDGDGVFIIMNIGGTISCILYENGTSKRATTNASFNDGLWHTITFSADRSSATGLKIYSGQTEQTYSTQESPVTLTGNIAGGVKYIGTEWNTTNYFTGDISLFRFFNYALDQTAVTYYSNPANHLKAVDQGANTVTDYLTGAGFTSGWTTSSATIDDANSFHTSGAGGIYKTPALVVGTKYVVKMAGTVSAGNLILKNGATSTTYIAAQTGTFTTSAVITATLDNYLYLLTSEAATVDLTLFTIELARNLLDLTAESFISPTLIRDWYHSTDIALTGTTAPRLVRQGNLTAWMMNGTTSNLTKANSSDGLTGDITISFSIFPTSWGEGNNGEIFRTTKILCFLSSATTGLRFSRDGGSNIIEDGRDLITLDQWNHIVITSTSSGFSTIYINGTKSGTAGSAGTPVSDATYFVGAAPDGSRTFQGVIESFMIHKKIWSAEDIALDYQIFLNGGIQ